MSEVKHTPGPWHCCHHLQSAEKDASCACGFPGNIWGGDGEHIVCSIGSHCTHQGWEMDPRYPRDVELANAQLIAAAPDLLAALTALYDTTTANDPELVRAARVSAVLAIHKATGT